MSSGTLADFKKQLFRIYSDVNKDIYGAGVIELKINLSGNMIIFFTMDNRVPALRALEERYCQLKQSVDNALFNEFKLRLKKSLKEKLGIEPLAMLRDYDTSYQMAVTIAVLAEDALKDIL